MMSIRLLGLVSAAALAISATAASADPRGATLPTGGFYSGSFSNPSNSYGLCHDIAYRCGVQAFRNGDTLESLSWFRLAARRGSVPAMRALGLIYLHGAEGLSADRDEAMGWFYQAALREDPQSMYALGRAFEEGVGVDRDPQLASFWIERAAHKGYTPARVALRQ